MGVWHNCIIFDFFYSEYWHNRLVLSFSVKVEVHSFKGRVGMRLSDCIFCGFIYFNLPGLLRQNAGSVLLHVHADNGSDLRLPDL